MLHPDAAAMGIKPGHHVKPYRSAHRSVSAHQKTAPSASPFPMQSNPQILNRGDCRVLCDHGPRPPHLHFAEANTGLEREGVAKTFWLSSHSLLHLPIPCQITRGSGAGGSRCPSAREAQDPGRKARAKSHKLDDAILTQSHDRAPLSWAWRGRGWAAASASPHGKLRGLVSVLECYPSEQTARRNQTQANIYSALPTHQTLF